LGIGSLHFRGDLLLRHFETKTEYRILNKELLATVVIGRYDSETGFMPTIDLTKLDSKEKVVSRHHASISPREDLLVVRDHKSLNGTYLNCQRLVPEQARVLRNGDMLRIGRICLIVYFEFPSVE
jgi:pSer/pThr/pTyr-binding forkhead associated (FHA) protein